MRGRGGWIKFAKKNKNRRANLRNFDNEGTINIKSLALLKKIKANRNATHPISMHDNFIIIQ